MSDVRDDLKTAANRTTGVKVHPYARQSTKRGDGYVRLDQVTYPQNGFGGLVRWQVVINLPSDDATAEKWLDDHAVGLVTDLAEVLIVQTLEQRSLVLDEGEVPVVVITGIREQE